MQNNTKLVTGWILDLFTAVAMVTSPPPTPPPAAGSPGLPGLPGLLRSGTTENLGEASSK